MRHDRSRAGVARGAALRGLLLLCAGLLPGAAAASAGAEGAAPVASTAASGSPASSSAPAGPAAALEGCVNAQQADERAATFSGEMTATPGTTRMSIRIELQQRLPGEATFHAVSAPGLGVWRASAPGVKVYRYIKQVTNLAAPAQYRAAVRFHWLNARGRLIRTSERRTPACAQHLMQPPASGAPAA
jgi:hypothetical protein